MGEISKASCGSECSMSCGVSESESVKEERNREGWRTRRRYRDMERNLRGRWNVIKERLDLTDDGG